MLSLAITALIILTGLIAAATVAHCILEARAAYLRLMREGEVMRAGFALQATAVEMALRPAPRRTVATRRTGLPGGFPLPRAACAA